MKRRRIYLHAGTHKTGSTSIQQFLFVHKGELRRRGYAVLEDIDDSPISPRPKAPVTNCLLIAHLFLRDDFGSQMKLRWNVRRYGLANRWRGLRALRRKLSEAGGSDIVISAEAFSFLRNWREKLMLRIAFAGYRLVPVVFLRERESWLASWEKQIGWLRDKMEEEGRMANGMVDDYRQHALSIDPDSTNGDPVAIRRFFGDRAIYLSYEEALERWGSTVPAFLAAIGLDPESFPDHADFWENRTARKARFRGR